MMMQERRIKENVTYRNLGGQKIVLEKELTKDEVVTNALLNGNWACYNFMDRREDFNVNFQYKLYYGKVDDLGYVVAEDELE